jgi:disulfide bond formation protein DsbB
MRRDGLMTARWIALLLPLGLIGGALFSQFVGHLVPCEMCMWQRYPHYTAIAVAVLAFVIPDRRATWALVAIAALLIGASGVIGVLHAGVEYKWWPGFTACTASYASGATGMEMIEMLRHAPMVRCDTAQWTLFGISLAGFNAILSITGALAIFGFMAKSLRAKSTL